MSTLLLAPTTVAMVAEAAPAPAPVGDFGERLTSKAAAQDRVALLRAWLKDALTAEQYGVVDQLVDAESTVDYLEPGLLLVSVEAVPQEPSGHFFPVRFAFAGGERADPYWQGTMFHQIDRPANSQVLTIAGGQYCYFLRNTMSGGVGPPEDWAQDIRLLMVHVPR